jgi:hypothetical protein
MASSMQEPTTLLDRRSDLHVGATRSSAPVAFGTDGPVRAKWSRPGGSFRSHRIMIRPLFLECQGLRRISFARSSPRGRQRILALACFRSHFASKASFWPPLPLWERVGERGSWQDQVTRNEPRAGSNSRARVESKSMPPLPNPLPQGERGSENARIRWRTQSPRRHRPFHLRCRQATASIVTRQ